MIALCLQHHSQADGGFLSKAQLREFKRFPFVDDRLKVRWPWATESMLIKIGPCLVLGSGSALRLDGQSLLRFASTPIPGLGARVVTPSSLLKDGSGSEWLRIEAGWLDLDVSRTRDCEFTPQTRRFRVTNIDQSSLALTVSRRTVAEFEREIRRFWNHRDGYGTVLGSIEAAGAIDSDERISCVQVEGDFVTSTVRAKVRGDRMTTDLNLYGRSERIVWHSHVVDESRRASIGYPDGPEVLSLG